MTVYGKKKKKQGNIVELFSELAVWLDTKSEMFPFILITVQWRVHAVWHCRRYLSFGYVFFFIEWKKKNENDALGSRWSQREKKIARVNLIKIIFRGIVGKMFLTLFRIAILDARIKG